jgi:hypothetical protein
MTLPPNRMELNWAEVEPATVSMAQFREIVTTIGIAGNDVRGMSFLPYEARQFSATDFEVAFVNEAANDAVASGRVMDFGDFPNQLMKDTSKRSGPLYVQGYLPMPFSLPWVLTHTWEEATAWYVIIPLEDGLLGADFEVSELDCLSYQGRKLLVIGDRAMLDCAQWDEATVWSKYPCRVCPSPWRFLPGIAEDPLGTAAGNVLDPVMTAITILATNGVTRETIHAPDKLQKARVKSGKKPIPPHERVLSEPYVTAIMQRRVPSLRGADKGGTHSSPVAHLRRGHLRTYKTGQKTLIRDTLINVSADVRASFKLTRSHYVIGS